MLKAELKSAPTLRANLGNVTITLQDHEGSYNRGYAEGYEKGYADGEAVGREVGYQEGLAARTYEIWTITLTDGTIVEKEVALL